MKDHAGNPDADVPNLADGHMRASGVFYSTRAPREGAGRKF